jgi:hypothetical protein
VELDLIGKKKGKNKESKQKNKESRAFNVLKLSNFQDFDVCRPVGLFTVVQ